MRQRGYVKGSFSNAVSRTLDCKLSYRIDDHTDPWMRMSRMAQRFTGWQPRRFFMRV